MNKKIQESSQQSPNLLPKPNEFVEIILQGGREHIALFIENYGFELIEDKVIPEIVNITDVQSWSSKSDSCRE